MKKLSDREKEILEIRKNFIEKVSSWESKIFYGLLLFSGSIIIAMIHEKVSIRNIILVSFLILVSLSYVEFKSWQRINRLHIRLVRDFEENKLEDLKDYSFCDYLNSKF